MNIWIFAFIVSMILAATLAFVWVALQLKDTEAKHRKHKHNEETAAIMAKHETERIFNDEFREELRNRGRQHFEKIIGENAMFLQQDLRLTTSQVNEYMKEEITRTLKEEFSKYEKSIDDAKQLAIESIDKTQKVIEQQRSVLGKQLEDQVETERNRLITRFESNMSDIINHYVLAAIGNQIDLSDQLEYILSDLENNKQAIIEDVRNGA